VKTNSNAKMRVLITWVLTLLLALGLLGNGNVLAVFLGVVFGVLGKSWAWCGIGFMVGFMLDSWLGWGEG
jgi:hypothetical protein